MSARGHRRNNSGAAVDYKPLTDPSTLTREQLIAMVRRHRERIESMAALIASGSADRKALRAEVTRLKRLLHTMTAK